MYCDICKKREASIFITEIINGEKKSLHLCFECATNIGIKGILKELNIPYDENIIKKFLSLMPGFIEEKEKEKICNTCGTKFDEFKKSGFLGCNECYEIFKDELRPIILNLHGSMKHTGKRKGEKFTPKTTIDEKIKNLKRELEYAIEEERYEDAAKIRDKIKELLNNVKNNS
ncbi:MAG: UvrB/UvrC motif-containing protein [Caldisericia bacterium]|nr:UvrB/UvrC motif-containing protein [Caldisericia bacterium]